MLSKNFAYTGHLRYFVHRRSPISAAPHSRTAWRSVKRSPPSTQYERPSSGVRLSFAASVVELNQRSSMPPRWRP